ncbi:MAG TPA: hypothetical protein VF457_01515, partial [Burkholderiaceae bacterium]
TTLASQGALSTQGSYGGALDATGTSVTLGGGSASAPVTVGGALTVDATAGDATLGFVHANGVTMTATGAVLLDGTLASTSPLSITAASIRGLESQGALDVASGQSVTLTATSGSIGQTPGTPATLEDPVGLITLLNGTGQGGAAVNVNFVSGQTAWFGVRSKESFQGLGISESSGLNSSTFGCDATSCFNILGQTTALADSVIANILNAAAQDAADAAFGTENLDFAIRKGYVTTIGRVPPGIDEIAGDLGSTQCDTRVTSSTSVAADKACSAPAPVPAQKAEAPAPAVPTLSAKGNLIVY